MKWGCIGLNYRSAPVEVRERFAVPAHGLEERGRALKEDLGLLGCVLLSTCNRMELYFSLAKEVSLERLVELLLSQRDVEPSLATHFYHKEGQAVATHLCEVLCGLDSMVVGETEIFGQVKQAYQVALGAGLTEASLNRLFQQAFSVGKKVRTQTNINRGATSVGSVAVELAEQIFGDLTRTQVLILGAGEMSRVTAQSLQSRGASGIFVANRSFERAEQLAGQMNGSAIRFDSWTEHLAGIDIVIASTAAPHYVVHKPEIEALRAKRKYRPLFFIDISVPRNVCPSVAEIEEVYLYDIDTLSRLADETRQKREQEIAACQTLIQTYLTDMNTPPQHSLRLGTRGSALALVQAEMTKKALLAQYPHLSVEIVVIKTTGDKRTDVPLSEVAKASGIVDKGVFIKELEQALLEEQVDLAVHSLKDMPSALEPEFTLGAVLPREDTRDVLVSKYKGGLAGLPKGACVATSSVRRRAQLLFLRPDLRVVDIRGNVPTRLEKLAQTESWEALILAQAGLNRLGIGANELEAFSTSLYAEALEADVFYPAAGQGAVALEVLSSRRRVKELLLPLNEPQTALCVRAEREFLRLLGAGCSTPVGVLSVYLGEKMLLKARLFADAGASESLGNAQKLDETRGGESLLFSVEAEGLSSEPEALAALLFEQVQRECPVL